MGDAAKKDSSMEDILSSIRKIIAEDGDPKTDLEQPLQSLSDPAEENVSENPAAMDEASNVTAEGGSISLAEIAANVKAGVMHTQNVQSGEVSVKEVRTDEMSQPLSEQQLVSEESEAPHASSTTQSKEGMNLSQVVAKMSSFKEDTAQQNTNAAQPAPVPQDAEPIRNNDIEISQQETVSSTEVTTAPEEATFKAALMSPSSNNAVSSSFDRLKRSSMDDMDAKTEAILRPMLREWLDENLPSMVERLVREEIERVSRGE